MNRRWLLGKWSGSANYFQLFGARPLSGRDFLPEQERPGAGLAVATVNDDPHTIGPLRGLEPGPLRQFTFVGARRQTRPGIGWLDPGLRTSEEATTFGA